MFGDKEVEEKGEGTRVVAKSFQLKHGEQNCHIFLLPHPLDSFKWDLAVIYHTFLKPIIFP